ncbi:Abortive infection C-terminus [Carboxydocella sporoproducens DSM 16521]|uniref:Abortive infection C-terminus n=2 Tax=Carboxydocella TaxID=178898 RepID=A0A1T4SIR8_9FIRM|nr:MULTISPECIES: abortive infection family protein [Carboxydocella]AVX19623.1 Abortive infection C-terminus [Carboxydocella thermautotrophica]SKA27731.1 Abortive infection C-terminus [Carboxydocella sporoproducens DSM 16521]
MTFEENFKTTLLKVWENEYTDSFGVSRALNKSHIYFEYTSIFTRREWNTYSAILHIRTPYDNIKVLEENKDKIFRIAERIFGKQDDYYLTDISIDVLIEQFEVVDFSLLGKTETIRRAISDAESFMKEGKYSSAIDRVHTSLHGYLRLLLDTKKVSYEESDTLMQLYSKLHNSLDPIENKEINNLIKSTIRSASAVIDSINTIRNKHSLSHPNEEIVGESEAKLVIGICKVLFDYIEGRT